MGFANRGPGDPYNRHPPVLIENRDTNFLGRIFLDELSAQNMWLLNPTNRESAARVIRIPPDFTEQRARGEANARCSFSAATARRRRTPPSSKCASCGR